MRKKVFSLILSAILVMALIDGIGLSARATTADEAAYADVFEQVRSGIRDGNYFEAYSPEISDISDISYAFYDINGDGVNELIFSGYEGGAIVYTLADGQGIELAFFPGSRLGYFLGIKELGYIVGGFSHSGYIGGFADNAGRSSISFNQIAPDGRSVIYNSLVIYTYVRDNVNGYEYEYELTVDGVTRRITQAEYSEYLSSISAPYVELDWEVLTEMTGVSDPQEYVPTTSTIPNAHPGPSPYSIIPDPSGGSDGFIGDWNADTGRFEITGLPGDVSDQIMYMDAPFELFHSFYINGVMQTRDVHYTVEEGSTRVTVVAQTITDLENGDHTAEAAFSRTDGSGLLDIVAQDFTVNLTRPAAAGGGGGQSGAQPLAADGQIPAALQSAPARNGNMLPIVIGIAAVMLAGGGIFYVVVVRNKKAKLVGVPDLWQPTVSQSPVPPQRPAMDAAGQKAAPAVFCVNCGVKLLEKARFCQNCGRNIN